MKILPLILIAFLSGCKEEKSPKLTEVLKSDCFWDITGDKQVIDGLNSCYKFLPNGQCLFYYYNFYNRKRTDSVYRAGDGDNIIPNSWSTQSDSLLIVRGSHYDVLSFSKDSVVVAAYDDTLILKKNCKVFESN